MALRQIKKLKLMPSPSVVDEAEPLSSRCVNQSLQSPLLVQYELPALFTQEHAELFLGIRLQEIRIAMYNHSSSVSSFRSAYIADEIAASDGQTAESFQRWKIPPVYNIQNSRIHL